MAYPSGRYPLPMLVEMIKGLAWARLDVDLFTDEIGGEWVGGSVVVDMLGQLKTYQVGTAEGFRYGAATVTKLLQAVGQYGGEFVVTMRRGDLINLNIEKIEPAQTHYLKLVALRRKAALCEREKLKAAERDRQLSAAVSLTAAWAGSGNEVEQLSWLELDQQAACVGNYLPFLTAEIARIDAEIAAIEAEQMPETGGVKRQLVIDAVIAWQDYASVALIDFGIVPAGKTVVEIEVQSKQTPLNTGFGIITQHGELLTIAAENMADSVNGSIEYKITEHVPAAHDSILSLFYLDSGGKPTQGAARFIVRME